MFIGLMDWWRRKTDFTEFLTSNLPIAQFCAPLPKQHPTCRYFFA